MSGRRSPKVLPELAGVLAGDGADVDDVGAGGLDLLRPARRSRSRQRRSPRTRRSARRPSRPILLAWRAHGAGEALAVDLGVVEDVGLGGARGAWPTRRPRQPWASSVPIDARVVAVAARVVVVRLARLGDALDGLRQARVRVRRADHDQAGRVQDRDGQLRGARVVGADVDHRIRVGGHRGGVRLLDRAVPVAVVGGRRVVEVEVLDREVADLLAVERLADLLDERVRLLGVRALARQAGVNVDLRAARALLVLARRRLGAGAARGGRTAASRCLVAGRECDGRNGGQRPQRF